MAGRRQPRTHHPYDRSVPEKLFADIERRFEAEQQAYRLGRRFQEWRSQHPSLERFQNVDELLDFFRDRSIPYAPKDKLAGILCSLSPEDELAELLLVKLYIPGLIAKRRGLFGYGLTQDELDSALVAGFLGRAAKTELGTEMLSGRLLTAARDRARQEIDKRADLLAHEHPTAVDEVFASAPEEPAVGEEAADLIRRALTEGALRRDQAEVLWAADVEGLSGKEAAARFGIAEGAARVRVHRARARLTYWARERPPAQR